MGLRLLVRDVVAPLVGEGCAGQGSRATLPGPGQDRPFVRRLDALDPRHPGQVVDLGQLLRCQVHLGVVRPEVPHVDAQRLQLLPRHPVVADAHRRLPPVVHQPRRLARRQRARGPPVQPGARLVVGLRLLVRDVVAPLVGEPLGSRPTLPGPGQDRPFVRRLDALDPRHPGQVVDLGQLLRCQVHLGVVRPEVPHVDAQRLQLLPRHPVVADAHRRLPPVVHQPRRLARRQRARGPPVQPGARLVVGLRLLVRDVVAPLVGEPLPHPCRLVHLAVHLIRPLRVLRPRRDVSQGRRVVFVGRHVTQRLVSVRLAGDVLGVGIGPFPVGLAPVLLQHLLLVPG